MFNWKVGQVAIQAKVFECGLIPITVLPTRCCARGAASAWCVHKIASKWAVGTERIGWVMLIMCRGTLSGNCFAGIWHNGCIHMKKLFTLQCAVSCCLNRSHVNEFGTAGAVQWWLLSRHYE